MTLCLVLNHNHARLGPGWKAPEALMVPYVFFLCPGDVGMVDTGQTKVGEVGESTL